ncbi:MAG: BamA/TamA family outer membrane protein [Bacteroidota bacterium]
MFTSGSAQGALQAWSKIVLLIIAIGLSSCGTNKYLQPGQTYLNKNKIDFTSNSKVKNKGNLKYELSTIYKQKPNSRFLFLFRTRLWFHHRSSSPSDTNAIKRFMRRVSEPPAIYDEESANRTAQSMQYYLQNKGYYDAKVTYKPYHKRKTTSVLYTVNTNQLYTIDSVFFISEDKQIERILQDISDESLLKPGAPLSESTFNKENSRVNKTLQNLGYAFFDPYYIKPLGDSTERKANIYYEIHPPKGEKRHKVYTIGQVKVIPSYKPGQRTAKIDTLIEGIRFELEAERSFLKPATLLKAIFLRPGDVYQIDNVSKTNSQLANLDIYKVITINRIIDTLDDSRLNFDIYLTPKKKMVLGIDAEINSSNYAAREDTRLSLFGTALSPSFRNRNLFRNATILSVEPYTGLEFDLRNNGQLFFSRDIKTTVDFQIPKFKDLNGFWWLMNRLSLISPTFYASIQDKAKTNLNLVYDNFSIIDFYSYQSFTASLGYNLQLSKVSRMQINTLGFNYLLPKFEEDFQALRDTNPFLEKSFDQQLFTGLLFQNFDYVYTGPTNRYGQSWYFRANLEISGLEVFAVNSLYNRFTSQTDTFRLNNTDFEHYVRLDLDLRTYLKFVSKYPLTLRLNVGIAQPYAFSGEVPYVKQFALGGPYSIRAWQIRELGPGSYIERNVSENIPFFQAGDFKLEFNAEWRFDIFSPIQGAIFLDGGNIWTLQEDERGPEAVLGTKFYNQIALGTGMGLRFDLGYFLFRLDFGVKMRQPFTDPENGIEDHWVLDQFRWKDINFNFALGLPF